VTYRSDKISASSLVAAALQSRRLVAAMCRCDVSQRFVVVYLRLTFHRSFWLIERYIQLSKISQKHELAGTLKVYFLKQFNKKGLFNEIKENPNFSTCRRILHIYRQWLLTLKQTSEQVPGF